MKVNPNKIRFFSPVDNADEAPLEAPKETTFTTTVTKTGRLAFPQKLMEGLRIDPSKPHYKVGTVNRRKGVKALYLMPTEEGDAEAFELSKTGRGYSIPLKGVLQKIGLNFQDHEYTFTVTPYDYGDGVSGFELVSDQQTPRTGVSDASEE
jgi:bifunctional DNA-binding transcriptional regulator/antitoxin component of YhaV-PrlF toxin-antitoxin module